MARLNSVFVVGVQAAEDDADEAAFEAAQGFCGGIAGYRAFAVVGLAKTG
jgi:hypothetical protein